jgi:intracellular septation protein
VADRKAAPEWLGWAVDGAPAVVFLIVLIAARDFRLATWFLVGASALALTANYAVERRIRPLPAISGALALVFGGASLLLHRPDIVQMKMTIVDGVLGAALFGGILMGKNPLKLMLGASFHLTDRAWTILAIRYGLFWWACAGANEVVRRTQTAETWAIFRVAVIVLAVVFALAQTPFLLKHNRPPGLEPTAPPPDGGF